MAPAAEPHTYRRMAAGPPAAAGLLAGVVSFVALNWLNAEWLLQFEPSGQRGSLVILAGVIAAGATGFATRYPVAGLWAGVALTVLVIAGLLMGTSGDVGGLSDSSWATPSTVIRHGAHFPVTGAVAGTLLAVSISVGRARAKKSG